MLSGAEPNVLVVDKQKTTKTATTEIHEHEKCHKFSTRSQKETEQQLSNTTSKHTEKKRGTEEGQGTYKNIDFRLENDFRGL